MKIQLVIFSQPAAKGFTLVETLIAILVLMMSIVGPLSLASQGLHTTLIAKDQDSAFYMAQDAVEFVRFVRDTNKLRGNTWLAGLDGSTPGNNTGFLTLDNQNLDCAGAAGCYVDSFSNKITTCGTAGTACPIIKYDSSINRYTYDSGSNSIFTRTVLITTPVGGNAGEASITVTVTWYDQGSLQRTVTVREDMFNWQ